MADNSKIVADLWEVYIGGNAAPHHLRVAVGGFVEIHYPTSGRTGSDRIGALIMGRNPEITLTLQEYNEAELMRFLGSVGAAASVKNAPAVGTSPAEHTLRLHDPSAGDAWGDLYFPRVVFGDVTRDQDGQGAAEFQVIARALRPADGNTWQLGFQVGP